MAIGIETYLTFAEFIGGVGATLEEFRRELVRYRREDVVRFCVLTNNAIYGFAADPSKAAHDEIVRSACPPKMLPLAVAARVGSRPLFHRQQLLFVAKQALLVCQPDGAPLLQGWSLAKLFLMASEQNVDSQIYGNVINRKDTLRLLANFIPVVEANRLFPFQHKFTRPIIMLSKVLPTFGEKPPFDLKKLFAEATGFEPRDYFGLIFAVLSACVRFNVARLLENPELLGFGPDFLIESKFTPSDIERFFREISADAEEYQRIIGELDRGLFDFTCFKDRPMFRVGSRVYPVDLHLLGGRCESALYWKTLEVLKGKDKERFRSFWGTLFQRYINWILERFADGKLNKFTADPTFDGTMEELCDGLVVCGSSAVLLEYKGGLFAANAKYQGGLEKLREDLEKKFVGTPENRKGVRQLANSIELLFSGSKKPVRGVDFSGIRKVYPMIVIHDGIAGAWMMNTYLNERFRELTGGRFRHLSNGIGGKVTVTPLFCISADHIEVVAEALKDRRFSDILDARYHVEKDLRLAFLTPDNKVLGDRARRIPQFLTEEMHEFTEKLKDEFKR